MVWEAFSMCAINFSHKNTPNESFWKKKFFTKNDQMAVFWNTLYNRILEKFSLLYKLFSKSNFCIEILLNLLFQLYKLISFAVPVSQRQVGSIADYDPLNGNWGTVGSGRSAEKIGSHFFHLFLGVLTFPLR
jgi:hypothetical protein